MKFFDAAPLAKNRSLAALGVRRAGRDVQEKKS